MNAAAIGKSFHTQIKNLSIRTTAFGLVSVVHFDMANRLGWLSKNFANIEQGFLDPTMLDLQDLATYIKKDLGALINNVFNRH